jgi:hypothetical protein
VLPAGSVAGNYNSMCFICLALSCNINKILPEYPHCTEISHPSLQSTTQREINFFLKPFHIYRVEHSMCIYFRNKVPLQHSSKLLFHPINILYTNALFDSSRHPPKHRFKLDECGDHFVTSILFSSRQSGLSCAV